MRAPSERMGDVKNAVIAVLVVFIGFWLFQDPHGLAQTAKHLSGLGATGLSDLFKNVITFVSDVS